MAKTCKRCGKKLSLFSARLFQFGKEKGDYCDDCADIIKNSRQVAPVSAPVSRVEPAKAPAVKKAAPKKKAAAKKAAPKKKAAAKKAAPKKKVAAKKAAPKKKAAVKKAAPKKKAAAKKKK